LSRKQSQFGVQRTLPFSASAFKNLQWSVSFLENREVTNGSFSSKATGVGAAVLFGTTANSIATEQRSAENAGNPSGEANALQGQADLIFQTHRLEICQATPANCPSK
jgi:hypothetical protein